ncbi:MAG: hypothetical protein KDH08_19965 [Anaerolineae bacterium]|nr:hypothetical protein [Anaerolineae bacterium]MCB0233605.1 hypothetical protein [Anaerolineae bacterium]MCB0240858.1 hypothetical protein [Anaerolineae bacterium]MCB9131256.1 hypothetical protein [Anaerolineales bacterium]
MRRVLYLLALAAILTGIQHTSALAQPASTATVKAVLFYSPTCPHCHAVINDTILPLMDQYGEDFVVIGIDITQPGGQTLYNASTDQFQIPQEMSGVPRLIIGETVLIGSVQIPQELPGLIDSGLANGGIGWPNIPGLAEALAAGQQDQQTESPAETPAPTREGAVASTATPVPAATATPEVVTITADSLPAAGAGAATGLPDGGWLAALILGGMLLVLGYTVFRIYSAREALFNSNANAGAMITSPLVPVLALLGLAVAAYLAYVEITQTAAVCGPVGECNAVQSSDYARIIGIPVAVLGIANYLAILGLWIAHVVTSSKWQRRTGWALLLVTVCGVLFSIYLTLLELFVIHAVCIWCLSSALITAALLLTIAVQLTRQPPADTPSRHQRPLAA